MAIATQYADTITNIANALATNKEEAANLANTAFNTAINQINSQTQSANAQNDTTYNQAVNTLNNQFLPPSQTTLNKLSVNHAQNMGMQNMTANDAIRSAETSRDNNNYTLTQAYLKNLNNAEQTLGADAITAAYNERKAAQNRADEIKNMGLKYYLNSLNFTTTSGIDKEIARLKKSNDANKSAKIAYLQAQKLNMINSARSSGGSGRRSGGYSGRSSYYGSVGGSGRGSDIMGEIARGANAAISNAASAEDRFIQSVYNDKSLTDAQKKKKVADYYKTQAVVRQVKTKVIKAKTAQTKNNAKTASNLASWYRQQATQNLFG